MVATATVEKIDQKTRHVTLKRPDGSKFTIVAGPEVRNLAQVKKGDVVKLEYKQSVAYEVNKAGSAKPGVSATTDVTRAEVGAKPGGTVTDTVTVRMTITAINKAAAEAAAWPQRVECRECAIEAARPRGGQRRRRLTYTEALISQWRRRPRTGLSALPTIDPREHAPAR